LVVHHCNLSTGICSTPVPLNSPCLTNPMRHKINLSYYESGENSSLSWAKDVVLQKHGVEIRLSELCVGCGTHSIYKAQSVKTDSQDGTEPYRYGRLKIRKTSSALHFPPLVRWPKLKAATLPYEVECNDWVL